MPLFRKFTAIVFLALLAGSAAQADNDVQGELTIVHPWSRATAPSQKAGGVFLKIQNAGDQPDRLIAIESEMADVASLHTTIRDGDVMKMRPVKEGIIVPAKGEAELAPGGQHIMLIGLRERLVKQTTFPLTLIFERAGRVEIVASVEAAGARAPSGAVGDHGQHGAAAGPAK
ncbi:MAG: copper chaperone PCu(A)C [Alphaproteobacteria bacterium]|nr:copper chaperone PCu(A)C [Alphaproteobacteria bacterium]